MSNILKIISILVPVLNEEDNILPLYFKITNIFESVKDSYDFELVFTDNHSEDKTFEILSDLALRDRRVKVLRFSKNFGFQKSIYAGYLHATGDAAIQIDCDLQDPPEMILDFIKLWGAGYDVVYGVRKNRKEGIFINASRKIFYRLINYLSEDELPLDAGDFRLVDRKIMDTLRSCEDSQPYLRGMIASFGFKQIGVEYDREERKRGSSKFNLRKLIALAMDGILSHSVVPLRLATYTGLMISIVTFAAIFMYATKKLFFGHDWPAGFATTTILMLLSISLNALFLGIIGEYLGRIYKQTKKTPTVIIESRLNV